ncbi:MAG TPA: DUF4261 domain-containing protein [Tepidisphaeraceae bacterium]|jgi:hypothetical protein
MPKGFFSQGVVLLTDGRATIADVKSAIQSAGFAVVKEIAPQELWSFGGPTVLVPFRAEVNGSVMIDVVDRAWPDTMGDPKLDPMTFGAWSMGYFGPFAYPGGLTRAIQHAWAWAAGRDVAPAHRGFIRIRSSYVGGARPDATCLPKDYEPVPEMMFVSRLAIAAGNASGVLCYFNPNGEVLRDLASFRSVFDACVNQSKAPLLLWMNVRLFALDGAFGLMDTVGNSQLDVMDIEVVYPKKQYDPNAIGYYVRNVTHYLLELGREIQTGEAIDGPGERGLSWTAETRDEGLVAPPRRVLRLFPKSDAIAIRSALAATGALRG